MIVDRSHALAHLGAQRQGSKQSSSVGQFGFFFLIPAILGAAGSIAGSVIGANAADAQAMQAKELAAQQTAAQAQFLKLQSETASSIEAEKTRRLITFGAIGVGGLLAVIVVSSLFRRPRSEATR